MWSNQRSMCCDTFSVWINVPLVSSFGRLLDTNKYQQVKKSLPVGCSLPAIPTILVAENKQKIKKFKFFFGESEILV